MGDNSSGELEAMLESIDSRDSLERLTRLLLNDLHRNSDERESLALDRYLDRFDRTPTGERIGYVSAMTMLEATDGDRRSYLEIAEVIEQASSDPTRDLRELWRRIVFFILISNTDDHLRNHGFLRKSHGGWRLAPAEAHQTVTQEPAFAALAQLEAG